MATQLRVLQKRTHLKHPRPQAARQERQWLQRFWMILATLTLFSIGIVAYSSLQAMEDDDKDSYVSLQARTVVGNGNFVLCKLSLLIDPEQEKRITNRKTELELVVRSVLSEAYEGDQRPPMRQVKDQLLAGINGKLPRKLQIRDVLIQELLFGIS